MSTLASHWIYAVIYIQQNRLVLANKLLQILYNTDKYWPNMVILSDLWKISWCLPFSPSAFFTGQTEKDWFGQNQYLPFKFDKCVGHVKKYKISHGKRGKAYVFFQKEEIDYFVRRICQTNFHVICLRGLNENVLPPFHAFHDLLPTNEGKQRHTSSYRTLWTQTLNNFINNKKTNITNNVCVVIFHQQI